MKDVLPSEGDLNCGVITTRKAYEGLETAGFTVNMAGESSFFAAEYGTSSENSVNDYYNVSSNPIVAGMDTIGRLMIWLMKMALLITYL